MPKQANDYHQGAHKTRLNASHAVLRERHYCIHGAPVFVPNDAKVESLALSPRGNGDWSYHALWGKYDHKQFTDSGVRMWLGKDIHQMFWGTIGFAGPEGADVKHPNLLKHVFTESQFHKIGDLPAAGKWVRLEVPVETLGLDGQVIDGFNFMSKGGNVW